MHEPVKGQLLGRYRLDALLGEGGMALVYRGTDSADGREVAIKVVHPTIARDPAFVKRFLRESRVFARLQHPNILPLYDSGEQNETPYLVMPYVAGGTLEDWLAERHPPREVVALIRPLAAALDHAHERGVIHRDVKPSNVLIAADGTPYLADFGIAHAIGDTKLTATGMHIGSAHYMAPEQVQGGTLTGAVDQYALASMLYEALVGQSPFVMTPTDTSFSLMLRKLAQAPPPPSSLDATLSPACDAVILRALAREPEQRFGSCTEMIDAMEQALANPWAPSPHGAAPPAPPMPPPMQMPPPPAHTPPPGNAPPGTMPLRRQAPPFFWIIVGVALGLAFCLVFAIVARTIYLASGDEDPDETRRKPGIIAALTPDFETAIVQRQRRLRLIAAGDDRGERSFTGARRPSQTASAAVR